MTTLTKSPAFDKAITEMYSSNKVQQNRRLELGEAASLRTSNNGIQFDNSSSDSDSSDISSNGSTGSYGSFGNRHSFISLSEENSSPSSLSASYAFMTSSRGSRILQEEELARLSDVPIDSIASDSPVNHHVAGLAAMERNIRSPSLGKDKRTEYFAKIKSEFLQGNALHAPTPPPSSSPEEDWGRRIHRNSARIPSSKDREEGSENSDRGEKDKNKDPAKKDKKDKDKQKEEKLKKKQEKKELKLKQKSEALNNSQDNPRIMQQLLGKIRFSVYFQCSSPLRFIIEGPCDREHHFLTARERQN
jgi:hypothetical protein